jgi:hypothetical protein
MLPFLLPLVLIRSGGEGLAPIRDIKLAQIVATAWQDSPPPTVDPKHQPDIESDFI